MITRDDIQIAHTRAHDRPRVEATLNLMCSGPGSFEEAKQAEPAERITRVMLARVYGEIMESVAALDYDIRYSELDSEQSGPLLEHVQRIRNICEGKKP